MLRHIVLGTALVAIAAAVLASSPIPQDPAYHAFADQRTCGRVANCLDVLSNIPFAVVGIWGLAVAFRRSTRFDDAWERWPYVAFFGGTALTTVGSAYYHLAPDNARLVWDRLPMTVGFMGFLAAMLAERIAVGLARRLFLPLLVFGAASVMYWSWSELRGAGDLRWYLLVQFGSLATVVLLVALCPSGYRGTGWIVLGLAAYGLAKVLEIADAAIFSAGQVVGGHALKHVAAALGVGCLAASLVRRSAAADDQVLMHERPVI